MNLYCANLADVQPRHWELLTPERQRKAARYKMPDDQKRCVAGGVLLRRFLPEVTIRDNGFGKPVADGICFNLSHSGEWILLAVDDKEIGCDIERHRSMRFERMGRVVFTENEMALLRGATDKMGVFYALWTKKEALLKCMGEGFHREAQSVDVCGSAFHDGNQTYHLRTLPFADYTVSVCSLRPEPVSLCFIDLKEL